MTQATDRPVAPNIAATLPTQRPIGTPDESALAPPTEVGDPGLLGLPAFLAAAMALGLVQIGFVPADAVGASIPIIMTAGGAGLLIAAIWSARLAQNANAGVFGIFAGFWFSYSALVLGLTHNWFGIAPSAVARSQEIFVIAWLVVIGSLTVAALRLPAAYVAVFALVDLALVFVLLGTIYSSAGLTKASGWVIFAFTAVGVYLFISAMSAATGGKPYPLGPPVIR